MITRKIKITLNGHEISENVEPRLNLADFLRHSLGATGTHVGCEHGVCGACTVNVDGLAVRSCRCGLTAHRSGLIWASSPRISRLYRCSCFNSLQHVQSKFSLN